MSQQTSTNQPDEADEGRLRIGDRVRVIEGKMAGCTGTVRSVAPRTGSVVLALDGPLTLDLSLAPEKVRRVREEG